MSKRMTYVGLVAGLMLPLAAWSAPLSYNFADIQYAHDNPKDCAGCASADGFQVDGSAAFADNFYVTGRYSDTSHHGDFKRGSLGVGYDTKIADGTSLYGQISYENVNLEKSVSGFGLEGGLRYALNAQAEVNAGIEYYDISDSKKDDGLDFDEQVGVKVGGSYDFTPQFAVVGSYEGIKNLDSWRVGVRWYWGA